MGRRRELRQPAPPGNTLCTGKAANMVQMQGVGEGRRATSLRALVASIEQDTGCWGREALAKMAFAGKIPFARSAILEKSPMALHVHLYMWWDKDGDGTRMLWFVLTRHLLHTRPFL